MISAINPSGIGWGRGGLLGLRARLCRNDLDRPTIFLPIYFYCPNICSKNLANLAIALNSLSVTPDKDFRVIALSFNEAESYEDPARAKKNYLKIVGDDFLNLKGMLSG